jgi:serine/threonine-protein kinase
MPDIRQQGGTYFLGRYRVVDEIGIGGMASVHLARMDGPGGFQKWVAVKKIHPHLVEDESFVQMFLDEARVAARISHPNVATVFDLGKHEDTYWIAMEYLHGEPLREVMRRTEELGTAMPPEIACRVIADAAEGLHAAHELLGKNGEKLGLVHRDVTPHNLFVTYDGVTKVVDFGIAKFSSRMSHTRAGTLKGKLAYMSPEQVHGEGIDRRTDIFALGVVLWELTTGQRLFRMESDLDTLAKVQECNVPRPSTLIRGYPVDLEKIVMKALAKNRGERFRTARELSRALQSLLMRRGLFIASDEVAAYVQSIFTDRIQKREAHLRWAAEVTQTINVEQMLSKPKIGPEYTNSEVQASMAGKPGFAPNVRPAAGMPLTTTQVPDTSQQGVPPSVPEELKSTGPSLTTPRGSPGPSISATAVPRSMRQPPRPAAGAAIPPSAMMDEEEPHPAEGDGPTIQALPQMMETHEEIRNELRMSEPPTLMEPMPGSNTDGPTMMANAPRGGMMMQEVPSSELTPIEPDMMMEEGEDETVVAANTRGQRQPSPLHAPPTFPQPPAGRPPTAQLPQQGQTQPPPPPAQQPRFAQTAALGQGVPLPISPLFGAPPPQEAAFSETMGMGFGPSHAPQPFADNNEFARAVSHAPQDYIPRPGAVPTGHSQEYLVPPVPSGRHAPTYQRMPGGPPTYSSAGAGTMTAERFKRRPPMWVVAALSCSIALLIAGVVIAVVSATGPTPPPRTQGGPGGVSTNGPFGSARGDFNRATSGPTSSAGPSTAVTAPAAPPPVATPGDTSTAAAQPAPPASAPPTATTAAGAQPQPTTTATTQTTAKTAATVAAAPPQPAPPPPQPAQPPKPTPSATATSKPNALGAITVVCMPKCDQIVDNGQSLGPGHIFNRPVPAGRHTLGLSAPNGVKKNLVVEVVPEQTREVRISMDR